MKTRIVLLDDDDLPGGTLDPTINGLWTATCSYCGNTDLEVTDGIRVSCGECTHVAFLEGAHTSLQPLPKGGDRSDR